MFFCISQKSPALDTHLSCAFYRKFSWSPKKRIPAEFFAQKGVAYIMGEKLIGTAAGGYTVAGLQSSWKCRSRLHRACVREECHCLESHTCTWLLNHVACISSATVCISDITSQWKTRATADAVKQRQVELESPRELYNMIKRENRVLKFENINRIPFEKLNRLTW